MKSVLPVIAALTLALAACGDPAPAADAAAPVADQPAAAVQPSTASQPHPTGPVDAASPSAADSADARFDGYGQLRLGMSAEETRKAWAGELHGAPGAGDACYHLSPKSAGTPAEFALMIEDGKFVRYSTESGKYVAPGGGRVGMGADEIKSLYAGRIEEQPHKYTDGKYLRIRDTAGSNALVFETDVAGVVTEWRVGVAPQVDYVEGCS